MPTKTDTSDSGDDDRDFKFDPEHPPEQWNMQKFKRLSIGDIRRLRKPDNGLLSAESQKSFNEVFTEWDNDLNARLKPALPSLVLPLPKIDLPKIDLPTINPAASRLLDESIRKSRQNLLDTLDISKSLGATVVISPEQEWVLPTVEQIEPVHHTSIDLSTTSAAEFSEKTSTEVEHLAVLESIREVLDGQGRAAARGAFFYILVGLTTALAGVATIVTMSTWRERGLTIGITVGLGLVAWVAYALVKASEKPPKTVKKQAPQ